MMNSTQDLILPNELPPYSPIVYKPPVKHPFTFETEYSRDPARVRAVFDELVEKTKEMNVGKLEVPSAKRRAWNLGLKVNIEQAKGLHWRSIQARHPVVLTAGPKSPPRTPRRPATDYPTAEQLCLKNMTDAQKKQNYAEAYRWSMIAKRERAISEWEAEQDAAFRARRAFLQPSPRNLSKTTALEESQTPVLGNCKPDWEKALSPTSDASRVEKDPRIFTDSPNIYGRNGEPLYPPVIEIPVPLMDRSQSIRPEAASSSYSLMGHDPMQCFNIPRGTDPSLWNARLSRSSSVQRLLPATTLRTAPTPLRPKIDYQSPSYPILQATRLSYIQPADSPLLPLQGSTDVLSQVTGSSVSTITSSQMTVAIPSVESTAQDQSFVDDYSLKKRRSEAEHHHASLKNEQKKFR